MTEKTITLRADLVERLETMASAQGRSVDDVLDALLESPNAPVNWALTLAEAMSAAEINWQDDPELSAQSRSAFQDEVYQKWQRSQQTDEPHG